MSSPLPNYLQTHRNRLALSQEEVAFLLGFQGEGKAIKVCRDEKFARMPTLEAALAYEVIYDRPVSELFAGLHQQIEKEVAARAKILTFRKDRKNNRLTAHKRQALTRLAAGQSKSFIDPQQA